MTFAFVRSAIAATRGSSMLRIASPSAGSASTSSAFASAIASMLPSRSMCDGPTLVTMPTSGCAMSQSSAISPRAHMPISSTARWWRCRQHPAAPAAGRSRCSGCLRSSGRDSSRSSTAAVSSFVVVLPTLPVMPTTLQLRARRAPLAREVLQRCAACAARRTARCPLRRAARRSRAVAPRCAACAT